MKYGDKATFHVEGVDKKGRGFAKTATGSKTMFVPFAVPGEEVEATVMQRDGAVLKMKLDRVITPSPRRVTPRCAFAGKCGGCAWQQFDYAYQCEMKLGLLNEALVNAGIAPLAEVTPAAEIFNYRNRMDYCVGWKGEVGLKEPGRWNAYVDLTECHLLSPDAVKAMAAFRDWMKANDVQPWDAKKQTGYLRYIVIREGKRTNQRMATIITSAGELPAKVALVAALAPLCTTLYHGINPSVTDLSISEELHLLHGAPLLEEQIDGRTFQIHPNAFFQTNTVMAEQLVHAVREFIGEQRPATLLDLYCGTGLFGICLGGDAERVVGVEIDARAIDMARINAERNGVKNAEYFAAKSEDLVWEQEQPDVVIIDPPRAGLHPKVVETLLAKKPERLVYVSCNYESFAREWKALSAAYRITKMRALDLFPHSPHVELVTMLERA